MPQKFLYPLIIVLLTALVTGGAVYFIQEQRLQSANQQVEQLQEQVTSLEQQLADQESNNETGTDTIDTNNSSSKALETKDWETYRNEEFGFSLKYPQFVNITENGEKIVFRSIQRGVWIDGFLGLPIDITQADMPPLRREGETVTECNERYKKNEPKIEQGCSQKTDTPVLFFSIESKARPVEKVLSSFEYGVSSAQQGFAWEKHNNNNSFIPSRNIYLVQQQIEGEGMEWLVLEKSPQQSLIIQHPITNCISDFGPNLEKELTFFNQCELFGKIFSTFRFLE